MAEASRRKIVSSRHLADGEGWEMSEVEFGMIIAFNAFSRWMVKCMSAAGHPEMSALDVLILHNVNHRGRAKKLSDICFVLNIEDSHTVTYALKKLLKMGLLTSEKRGKEVFYQTSDSGEALCAAYAEIRQQCLLGNMDHMDLDGEELSQVGRALRALSGHYDQASRAASSL